MSRLIDRPVAADEERYVRQTIYPAVGEAGQERIGRARALLVGCGALGTHIADALVRSGLGFLRIADRDVPVLHNLQRQSLFDEADVAEGLPKAVAAARRLAAVNREVVVEPVVVDVNPGNIEGLLADVDFVLDGTDNFEARYLINDACVKHGRAWVYGGVIGSYGMSMTILPGETPCLRCIFPESPAPGDAPTCDTAGVLGPVVSLVASVQAAEGLKLALGRQDALSRNLLSVDIWDWSVEQLPLAAPRPECLACGAHDYSFLNRSESSQTTSLCGRDAVQVLVHPPLQLSLPRLAERLAPLGEVAHNPFLLRARLDGYELTVFPDGRAIVKGTTDSAEARSVYARFIGM